MARIHTLTIENDDFSPKDLVISLSDEIEIFITGFTPAHTFYTIFTEGFSLRISPGDKLRHKFLKPGEFSIKCKEYSWMTAKISILPDPPRASSTDQPTHKPAKNLKKVRKAQKKHERTFLKNLQNSEEFLSDFFQLVVNIGKIAQEKLGKMNKDLVREKIFECKLKIPEKFKQALESFGENFEAEEFLQKMTKCEIVEKALGVCLNRETAVKYTSNLCVERVEKMLEDRWNSC